MYILFKSFTDPVALILILIGFGLWMLKDRRKDRSQRFGLWGLLAGFLLLYFLSISPVTSILSYIMERDYLTYNLENRSEIDVIVVLGGGIIGRGLQSGYDPSDMTSSRLLFGLQALKHYNAKFIVFSGKGWSDISEAEVMSKIAKRLGVDPSKIIVESKSHNTWEHGIELEKLFKNSDVTVGIVTSAIHMRRSEMVFKKYFTNIVALPSTFLYSSKKMSIKDFIPKAQFLYNSSMIFHEIFGLLSYSIKQ